MATKKAKRSVRKKQLAVSDQHSAKSQTKNRQSQTRRVVHYAQAKGKTVEDVEFSTSSDYHNISINFQDKTSLNLSIETGFALETDYSNWKTGNQRVLRAWRPIRSL